MLILFLMTGCVSAAQSEEMNVPPKPQGGMKPPPEAITACKGKSEGTVPYNLPTIAVIRSRVSADNLKAYWRLCRSGELRHRKGNKTK